MARGSYRIPEYKPFFGQMMQGIAQTTMGVQDRERTARIQAEKNKLARDAWMGDQSAMGALQQADPELAMKVEDQRLQREARAEQQQLRETQEARAVAGEARAVAGEERAVADVATAEEGRFEDDMERVVGQIAQFPNYDAAKIYGQQQTDQMSGQYPELWASQGLPLEFDEQSFNDIKTAAGPQELPPTRDTQIIKQIGKDGKPEQAMVYSDTGQPVLDPETNEPITFGPEPSTAAKKEPSGEEKKSAGYLIRMQDAQIEIEAMMARAPDFDPSSKVEISRGKLNWTSTPEMKDYKILATDWIRAKLRKESGAVIGEIEMADEYALYFPVFGDEPPQVKLKAGRRRIAEDSMKVSASRAWVPGIARGNPLMARDTDPNVRPPKGTWVELPDGTVRQL